MSPKKSIRSKAPLALPGIALDDALRAVLATPLPSKTTTAKKSMSTRKRRAKKG